MTQPCTGATGRPEACTAVQSELPGARMASPVDGVVVRWRERDARGRMRLAVVRGTGARAATAATSEPVQVDSAGAREFDARVPIREGERIALQLDDGARLGLGGEVARGARLERFSPPLGPVPASASPNPSRSVSGSTSAPSSSSLSSGPVFGDRTQDRCPRERGAERGCR